MTVTDVRKLFFPVMVFFITNTNLNAQNDETLIKKTIGVFFEGFAKSDSSLVSSISDRNMDLKTVIERNNGQVVVRTETRQHLMQSIAQPRKEKFEERIVHWDIKMDGAYANAWCTYELYLDSSLHHWGIDNFQLLKETGKWRILAITDTRNKTTPPSFSTSTLSNEIDLLLNNWHKAAATADEKIFFGSMDSSAIYLGTDKTEYWTKQEFEKWSKKYFDQDKAWDFTPHDRHIYFSKDLQYAWFDELLDTWMGACRGSGVLSKEKGQWKLLHYNLAVTVANDKIKQFVKINK
jgi:hypothetical protein